MNPQCNPLQQDINWCEGRPSFPGIQKTAYYISKSAIAQWPELEKDEQGRVTSTLLKGSFVLKADQKWHRIDHIADKATVTSESQGEYPSQTQLNKVTLVHPGVDKQSSMACVYLNNNDNVFLVRQADGSYRVVGSPSYPTKTTVAQDLGQGATGSTSTTINVEATDFIAAPFYEGEIECEEGTLNEDVATE